MSDEPPRIKDLSELQPHIQKRFLMARRDARRLGVDAIITETRRTKERQNWLYASGRTRPGPILTNVDGDSPVAFHVSAPGECRAFDFFVRSMVRDDIPTWSLENPWSIFASLLHALGFTVGASWRAPWDLGHAHWEGS